MILVHDVSRQAHESEHASKHSKPDVSSVACALELNEGDQLSGSFSLYTPKTKFNKIMNQGEA